MTSRLVSALSVLVLAIAGQGSETLAQDVPPPPPEIADKVVICATCHGADGTPVIERVPIIWGQHLFYIMIQLRDYRDGRRTNEIMAPMAKELSDDQIKALAGYFSALPWPSYREPAEQAEIARARALEVQGQCAQCHLDRYRGNSDVPRVGNQKADYTEQTLRDYRDGVRLNSPPMAALVEGWSDEDIAAVAHYLAGL